jgi:hypothetical protein
MRIMTLSADPAQAPAPATAAVLEAVRVVGASVMHPSYLATSLDKRDVNCDVVEFKLINKGKEPFEFSVFGDHSTCPRVEFEALVDGAWRPSFPVLDGDGNETTYSPPGFNGGVLSVVVKPGGNWTFLLHLERWRYSVANKLRITLSCYRPLTSPGGVTERVTSNGFSLKGT